MAIQCHVNQGEKYQHRLKQCNKKRSALQKSLQDSCNPWFTTTTMAQPLKSITLTEDTLNAKTPKSLIPPCPEIMSDDRTLLHTRSVQYQGFIRKDGLWEIEATLRDTKGYDSYKIDRQLRPADEPVHFMNIRMVLNDDLVIQNILPEMKTVPFDECNSVLKTFECMRGVVLGTGWRKALTDKLGGIRGCTHLRELLFNMATVAFQTIPFYLSEQGRQAGQSDLSSSEPPRYLGQCHAWRLDGPVVMQHFPQFHRSDAG
jgi:hypothetical protein